MNSQITSTDILGIDPGLDGAIARISKDGQIVTKYILPTFELHKPKKGSKVGTNRILDIHGLCAFLENNKDVSHCFLESVSSRPQQGVASVFKFGRVFGNIEALVIAHKIPMTLVTPQAWTKVLHQGMPKVDDSDAKTRSLLAFSRLFPNCDIRASERCKKPHDGLLDAILIAEYGRRQGIV